MDPLRVNAVNAAPVAKGDFVLYWMIAARRATHNLAIDHALAVAKTLDVPLLVLEPLRCGYAWASDRMHAFVLDGMADQQRAFAAAGITYYPYVEREAGAGKGLLAALAKHACCVITDEQPGFFLPQMVAAAGTQLPVRLEQVDGNGLLPLRATTKSYPAAMHFRRHLQKTLPLHLAQPAAKLPRKQRAAEIPAAILRRWPPGIPPLAELPIDHDVPPAPYRGGAQVGTETLADFVDEKLARYEERSHPDADVASGLSPYLHFGHVGAHQVFAAVAPEWDPTRLGKVTGTRYGWWGLPAAVEAFLDEVITWRELGYHYCFHERDYTSFASLPEWAKKTLEQHAKDPRPHRYTRAVMEAAETADPLWNAAQRQLLVEGRIQNYMRMLWGKKILEWSSSPKAALATLVELNNKYSVDGRDPNSWSGIMWTLGRFDRPWPKHPIYGAVRMMTSESAAKKLDLKKWLAQWS